MIILRKKSTNHVEKIIQPGQTEQFFDLDLSGNEAYDWNIKIRCMGKSSITKITSLYNDDFIESTKYAFLGVRFNADTNILVSGGSSCSLSVTNNESELMTCSVKVKTF
jgi:hypothetical protein